MGKHKMAPLSASGLGLRESALLLLREAPSHIEPLRLSLEHLRFVDETDDDDTLASYVSSMHRSLARKMDFIHHQEGMRKFLQKLGEAHFYCLMKRQGLRLERLKETDESTPDFRLSAGSLTIHFEVKTPESTQEEESRARDFPEKSNLRGRSYSPYGSKLRKRGFDRGAIETLAGKVLNSYKFGQFASDPTFLVVNLLHLHPMPLDPLALRPIGIRAGKYIPESGLLWMAAFARKDMPIFETHAGGNVAPIRDYVSRNGVLLEHKDVAGIIFIVNSWLNGETSIAPVALFRSASSLDIERQLLSEQRAALLREAQGYLIEHLVDPYHGWNDERDSNGDVIGMAVNHPDSRIGGGELHP